MRPKNTLLLGALCSIPSFLDYMRGYLSLSDLFLRVIVALVFALLATELLSRLVEWVKIEERRLRRHRPDKV